MSIKLLIIFFILSNRWQARKEGDRHMRAGLIPSRALQEKRIVHERSQGADDEENGMLCFCFAFALHGLLDFFKHRKNVFPNNL